MNSRWRTRGSARCVVLAATLAVVLVMTSPALASDTLYDQYDHLADYAANSQEYETAGGWDQYTAEAADDFVVPIGQSWSISHVDFGGVYYDGTGPAYTFTVRVYENGPGNAPGELATQQFNLPFTKTGFEFSADIAPVKLDPGTYWLSIQARQDISETGRFGWLDRAAQSGMAAVFENPQNGGGTNCTAWTARITCNPDSYTAPDQVFALSGTSTAIPAPKTKIIDSSVDQKKRKAKLSFTATGGSTGFECALVKQRSAKPPAFRSCRSPKTYRHLKPGKYDFSVRALGPGGTDATPATKSFRIKKR